MNDGINKKVWNSLILLACLVVFSTTAFSQSDTISLSSGTGAPGVAVSLPLSLSTSGGSSPAGLQWMFSYSPSDFTAVSVSVAGTATTAGKTADCAPGAAGQYVCLITGINSNAIAAGVVATANFTVSPGTLASSSYINVLNSYSASGAGVAIPATGVGATVTIPQSGPALTGFSCTPSSLQTPASSVCTVTLGGAAPTGGVAITTGYTNPSGAQVTIPATVTVPAGATSTAFTVQVGAIASNSSLTVTAAKGATTLSFVINLIAAPGQWSISGTITPSSLGSGTTVKLAGAASATTTADASGNYKFTGLSNGSYTVTPAKSGDLFTPASQAVTVASANLTSLNFTASTAPTWTLSGNISPSAAGAGAVINLTGAKTATATADASGNYSFGGLSNGTYSVTPSKSGYTFTPSTKSVVINGANLASVNFTAAGGSSGIVRDAQASADQGTASSRVTSPAFSTNSANELLLAFVSTDYLKGSNTTVTSVTGAGLTWVLVGRTNVQLGTAEIWRAFAPSPLSSVTVTANLSQSVVSSITVMSFSGVSASGTNGSGAIGAVASANARSGAPAATLVTTHNNSLVVGVGNDFDQAIARTPGYYQSIVHQDLSPVGDTYWVQIQNGITPLSGTTVQTNDTAPTSDRYNFMVCEIIAGP